MKYTYTIKGQAADRKQAAELIEWWFGEHRGSHVSWTNTSGPEDTTVVTATTPRPVVWADVACADSEYFDTIVTLEVAQ